jgi:hypothetical protein
MAVGMFETDDTGVGPDDGVAVPSVLVAGEASWVFDPNELVLRAKDIREL